MAQRAFTSGKLALDIEGIHAGWVHSVEGGGRIAEVVSEKLSLEHYTRKHIAGLKYEDITITCGIAMSKHFWEFLHKSLQDNCKRIDGSVHVADYDWNIVRTLDFHNALITEIGFPGLDASSKDSCKLTLKLSPEWTRTHKGSGKIKIPDHPLGKGKQKRWLPSNFRLRIDGLDHACEHVNKIEPLVIKQKVVDSAVGEMRHQLREPAGFEFPNLIVSTSEARAHPFWHWEKQFIIHGKNSDDDEKTGTLEYLSSDLSETLFTVEMHHIGLFKVSSDKLEAGSEAIRRVKAEMYVEHMKFEYDSDAVWA